MDLPRGLRSPLTVLPTAYLAAFLASWWLDDDGGRDAVRRLPAESKPNWQQEVRQLLTVAAGWRRRRKGPAADEVRVWCSPPANRTNEPPLTTLQRRWHAHVVDQNALAPLVRAMAVVHPQPTTSCAAAARLAHARGLGP